MKKGSISKMKYQVYLNKDTSEFINKLAEHQSKKPNTCIKELVESFVLMTKPVEEKLFEEIRKNGKRK